MSETAPQPKTAASNPPVQPIASNLLPSDAARLYSFLRIGDPVEYPNANGPQMSLGAGYGDWNLSWSEWQTGGLVSTT